MDKIKFSKDYNSLWIEKICVIYKDKVLFLRYKNNIHWDFCSEFLTDENPLSDFIMGELPNAVLNKQLNIEGKYIENVYAKFNGKDILTHQDEFKYKDNLKIRFNYICIIVDKINNIKVKDKDIIDYIWLSKEELENNKYYINDVERKIAIDTINYVGGILPTSYLNDLILYKNDNYMNEEN